MKKIKFDDVFAGISTCWDQRLVGELNGQHVKCTRVKGEFVWHHHENEDGLFLVHRGVLHLRRRERTIVLEADDLFVVPRGIEYQPYASEEAEVILFEPASTVNTAMYTTN
jgi:mannose-6-phosphate isomerase-like protein (cupin superfamily)